MGGKRLTHGQYWRSWPQARRYALMVRGDGARMAANFAMANGADMAIEAMRESHDGR
jgi:hypothetical protein